MKEEEGGYPRAEDWFSEEGEYENNKASRAQDVKEGGHWVGEFIPIFSLMLVKMSCLSG